MPLWGMGSEALVMELMHFEIVRHVDRSSWGSAAADSTTLPSVTVNLLILYLDILSCIYNK